jgi:subtilisin family serine protease
VTEPSPAPIQNYVELFERTIANFVLGEVCIVASAADVGTPADLYESVRQGVNRTLTDCLHPVNPNQSIGASLVRRTQQAAQAGSVFARDLDLSELLDWSARLQQLGRQASSLAPGGATSAAGGQDSIEILSPLPPRKDPRNPWIVLPRQNAPATLVCFFALNPAVGPTHHHVVRQVVNCVNVHAVVLEDERLLAVGSRIIAATPNWLTIGAADHGCGGPAGPPEAVPSGRASATSAPLFRFDDNSLEAAAKKAAGVARGAGAADVVVAILDTSPRQADVLAAATPPDPRANWLMRDVAQTVHLDGSLSLDPSYFDFLSRTGPVGILPNWQGPEVEAAGPPIDLGEFAMVDHGLFVAGIIRHLAPAAEVHLLRVLGDDGVGDLFGIISTLAQLPRVLQTSDKRRLIVNMSLGADIPTGERLLARWFPHSYADPAMLRQHLANICKVCEPIDRALREVADSLDEQGVLLIAAVGNDFFTLPTGRKEPRYPARYESVLGVTAMQRSGRYADYSNLGDEAVVLDDYGVATYGGNASLPGGAGSGPPRIDTAADPVDAIVGIFSAPTLPALSQAPRENKTGWVYWAGTSFATPIVTAIAANLWLASPNLDHHQIHRELLALGVPADGPPADGYPDVPVIKVLPS